jgi:hypothetical protein
MNNSSISPSYAERARARNTAAVAAWETEQAAAWAVARSAAVAEEESAFLAPLTNKERCDALRSALGPFAIKGGFRLSVRVAFFGRRGEFLRLEQSVDCTWAGDAPPRIITSRAGDAYARTECVWHGNSRGNVWIRTIEL